MNVNNAGSYQSRMQEIFDNTIKVMPYTGYRIVLGDIKLTGQNLSFILANIGISRIFHDYYQLHLLVKTPDGKLVYDRPTDFDFRTLDYCKGKPLTYFGQTGKKLSFKLPKMKGMVFIIIKDKYGIDYPMTLSNYGRLADSSYYLGEIKCDVALLKKAYTCRLAICMVMTCIVFVNTN